MQIIQTLYIENWLYLIAIPLQCAGAILLIYDNFSCKRDKLIEAFVNASRVTIRNDDKQKVQFRKTGLRDLYVLRLHNKISFMYILIGTLMATYGEGYPREKQYFLIIVLIAIFLVFLFIPKFGIRILAEHKEKKNPNYFSISTDDLDRLKMDPDINVITNAEIDKIVI